MGEWLTARPVHCVKSPWYRQTGSRMNPRAVLASMTQRISLAGNGTTIPRPYLKSCYYIDWITGFTTRHFIVTWIWTGKSASYVNAEEWKKGLSSLRNGNISVCWPSARMAHRKGVGGTMSSSAFWWMQSPQREISAVMPSTIYRRTHTIRIYLSWNYSITSRVFFFFLFCFMSA